MYYLRGLIIFVHRVGGGQLDHGVVHWQGGVAYSYYLWQCDRNCACPLWYFSAVLVSASLRHLKLVHQYPFPGHVSVHCLHPQTADIFQSSRQQHLRNNIFSVWTSSDRWSCSTWIRGSSLCNRVRKGMNSG